MKIKVGDKIYDGLEQPVMVVLSESDKENIKNMADECTKYCQYPDTFTVEQIEKFMKIETNTNEITGKDLVNKICYVWRDSPFNHNTTIRFITNYLENGKYMSFGEEWKHAMLIPKEHMFDIQEYNTATEEDKGFDLIGKMCYCWGSNNRKPVIANIITYFDGNGYDTGHGNYKYARLIGKGNIMTIQGYDNSNLKPVPIEEKIKRYELEMKVTDLMQDYCPNDISIEDKDCLIEYVTLMILHGELSV